MYAFWSEDRSGDRNGLMVLVSVLNCVVPLGRDSLLHVFRGGNNPNSARFRDGVKVRISGNVGKRDKLHL